MTVLVTPRGVVEPRIQWVPEYGSSAAGEAIDLCEHAGLFLDDWQKLVITHALGERDDGRFAAFEVGVNVSRQNGKGSILEARELAGLFVLGERLIIHSAHQFDTSLEAFRRLLFLIENTADLWRRVKRVSRSHGEEGIELKSGQRIRFRTRTKGGGRGFTGDCLLFDEAMILPETAHGALLPTLSARPNPQVWYTGSAVDQQVHEHGLVFARVRDRGIRGGDPGLAYFEWSAAAADDDGTPLGPSQVGDELAASHRAWAEANPGLGIRIDAEHVEKELRSMDSRTFAVERLGVGDWPATDGSDGGPISVEAWDSLLDVSSTVLDPVCFAVDVSPDRSSGSIAAAGLREDGLLHAEIVERRRGTGWIVDRLVELVERNEPAQVVCDGAGPVGTLLPELSDRGVLVVSLTAQENGRACGMLVDLVEQRRLRHPGAKSVRSALRGAAQRPLGDAWAWSRKNSTVDISPLVALTLACWSAETMRGMAWVGW